MLRPFLLLSLAASLPLCPVLLESGAWTFSATSPPEQGAWVPSCGACATREWDLRDRAIALVGDSVSRYMFSDLGWRTFGCPPLDPPVATEQVGALPNNVDVPAMCTVLYEFIHQRMKSNLVLFDEARNTTFAFFWLEAFSKLREDVAPLLWGQDTLHFDSVFINAGLWDVRAHRNACVAMSDVADILRGLEPRDKAVVIAWTTVFSEPVFDNVDFILDTDRFPAAATEAANACMLQTFRAAGVTTFDVSAIVRAPRDVLARMPDPHSRPYLPLPPAGALLTRDGFHPNERTRAALWGIFENAVAARWEAGAAPKRVRARMRPGGRSDLAGLRQLFPVIVIIGTAILVYSWVGIGAVAGSA